MASSLGIGVGLAALPQGCSESWHPAAVLDCSQEFSYDKLETYEPNALEKNIGSITWDGYGDTTPGAFWLGQDASPATPPAVPIENGGRCGSTQALLLQSTGHHDYGSGYNDYRPGGFALGLDVSAYEGVAFWARSPGNSTKGVTLTITDENSYNGGSIPTACTTYTTEAGNGGVTSYTTTTNVGNGSTPTGSTVASAQPPANACGNAFQYELVTSSDWQLYRIPFSAFQQTLQPNRVATGFDASHFFTINVLVPREADLQLWFDDFGFYPHKTDGGL